MEPRFGESACIPSTAKDEEKNVDDVGQGEGIKKKNTDLDRLLRSAAAAEEILQEPPFGFDTRLVALWRAANGRPNDVAELTPFLRRIGVVAFVVLTLAGAGVYSQFNDNETRTTPQTNDYAIADSAIQTEFSQ